MIYEIDSTLIERFWVKVDKTGECWTWTAARNPYRGDYGIFWVRPADGGRGRTLLAHRISWEIANGPILDGLLVLHRCDNPPCVRPDHLFLGTDLDNQADMIGKRRRAIPANRKFAEADIADIRALHAGGASKRSIARRYGVALKTIQAVLDGKTYSSAA